MKNSALYKKYRREIQELNETLLYESWETPLYYPEIKQNRAGDFYV